MLKEFNSKVLCPYIEYAIYVFPISVCVKQQSVSCWLSFYFALISQPCTPPSLTGLLAISLFSSAGCNVIVCNGCKLYSYIFLSTFENLIFMCLYLHFRSLFPKVWIRRNIYHDFQLFCRHIF